MVDYLLKNMNVIVFMIIYHFIDVRRARSTESSLLQSNETSI